MPIAVLQSDIGRHDHVHRMIRYEALGRQQAAGHEILDDDRTAMDRKGIRHGEIDICLVRCDADALARPPTGRFHHAGASNAADDLRRLLTSCRNLEARLP
jgi:hypothetical protein